MWPSRKRADRRRATRTSVRWVGRYMVQGSPGNPWSPCAIQNISAGGTGLMLHGGMAVTTGQALLIELERIGPTPVSVRIRGTAKSVGHPSDEGTMDIGVLLTLDDPHEQRIAGILFAG
jgi:hypothetical protein